MRILFLTLLCAAWISAQKDPNDEWVKAIRGQYKSSPSASPTGFTVSAQSGASGRALTGTFPAGMSAKGAFSMALRQVTSTFDRPPALQSAMGDAKDQQVQAFFRASYQGTPVRGLMVVAVQGGKAYAAVLFDREDLFSRSLPFLSKQMSAALPKTSSVSSSSSSSASASAPAAVPQLTKTQLTDGSGWISLAPGWRITGAFKGTVDAVGPNNEFMSLGGYQNVFYHPLGQLPEGMMSGPYRAPWPAFAHFADVSNKYALSQRRGTIRLIEQVPDQYPNGQAAWLAYEFVLEGKAYRGLAWVATAPLADISWFYYCSYAGASAELYPRVLPTLVAMWKSWGVSQAVFRERMDAALKSMRETYQIMQSIHDNQMRTYDNVNTAWDQTIRGVTTIEHIDTGGRGEVDSNHAQHIVDELNRQGYNFRIVPINELTR